MRNTHRIISATALLLGAAALLSFAACQKKPSPNLPWLTTTQLNTTSTPKAALSTSPVADEVPEGLSVSTGGGYIAASGGYYYFANRDDDNRLYRMDAKLENKQKLSDLKNSSWQIEISIAGGKLYYLQNTLTPAPEDEYGYSNPDNDTWDCALYACDLKTGAETKLVAGVGDYAIGGGWIFYSKPGSNSVFRAKPDGTGETALTKNEGEPYPPFALQVRGNKLFYCWNEKVFRCGLDGKNSDFWPLYSQYVLAYGNYMYYPDMEGYLNKLFTEAVSAGENYRVAQETISAYALSGGALYYAAASGNAIYRTDLNGNDITLLAQGYDPIPVGGKLFFTTPEGVLDWVER